MKTKLIALDIYGTILSTDDPENARPVRRGFEKFLDNCGVPIVTASDAYLPNLKNDLMETFSKSKNLNLDIFDNFYELTTNPKDFSKIIWEYLLDADELFVIGDNLEKDIQGAITCGCNYFHVPEYVGVGNTFDFSSIVLP